MQRPPLPPRTDSPAGGQPQASTNRPAIGSGRDSLQRIGGINSEIERLLNTHGVTRYSQIAGWSSVEVDRFDRLLGHRGRIQRESWVEQAQILAKGGDTAFSRSQDQRAAIIREATAQAGPAADTPAGAAMDQSGASHAAARGSDLSSLRSVRSEAFRPSDGAPPAPTARPGEPVPGRTPRGPALDDLKRIRGVGVLIEKKLHSMGISRYDQIAGWSAADIDRVSDFLDFKGRIERENWVEQARILAAGGQTEFSRRIDRGEPI